MKTFNTPSSLNILIRADNDFYSVLPHLPPDSNRTPADVAALPKFLPCPVDPDTGKVVVHKTGLGSSAALTTSMVGALVHYFRRNAQQKEQEEEQQQQQISAIIHNLAQICHCHAQGKVGSGFDVSAACHGTHVYRRFPKCLLPDLLQQLDYLGFIDAYHDRIKMFHVKDAEFNPTAKQGLYSGYQPWVDRAARAGNSAGR